MEIKVIPSSRAYLELAKSVNLQILNLRMSSQVDEEFHKTFSFRIKDSLHAGNIIVVVGLGFTTKFSIVMDKKNYVFGMQDMLYILKEENYRQLKV